MSKFLKKNFILHLIWYFRITILILKKSHTHVKFNPKVCVEIRPVSVADREITLTEFQKNIEKNK